ncbi:endo-alpha-N-acetylgalactosaminidase [Streptococcus pneumoniae]|nr:endo-alpha-N-acetylgalactosaminidase [Streptococcus pneumoniae]
MNKGLFEKRCKYSIRKFSLGVASVMIGAAFFGTSPVLADSVQSGSTANLPADLATALATAKENDGRDFEAPKVGEDQGSPEVTDGPKTEEELLALEKEKPKNTVFLRKEFATSIIGKRLLFQMYLIIKNQLKL